MRLVRSIIGAALLAGGLAVVGAAPSTAGTATFSFQATMFTEPEELWTPVGFNCHAGCTEVPEGTWLMYSQINTEPGHQEPVSGLEIVDAEGTWEGFCGQAVFEGRLWAAYDEFALRMEWVGTTIVIEGTGVESGRPLTGIAFIMQMDGGRTPRPQGCLIEPGEWHQLLGQIVLG